VVAAGDGEVRVRCGESCVVPAAAGALEARLEGGTLIATRSSVGGD